eukprot:TRINITY_DN938_c0_g1_i2.p1 TRINITY_DN938_c0_g1~~TRINITY_DN938_c0_g1_i2.p1  ORF type:complete len:352 (+),score=37.88 TRINITY_DN938_c0_g1_i2:791-1846(+)
MSEARNHPQQRNQRSTPSPSPTTTIPTPTNWKEELIFLLTVFYTGVRHSFSVGKAYRVISRSKSIQKTFANCLFLNGGLFLLSHLVYDRIIHPHINSLFSSFGDSLINSFPNVFGLFYYMLWIYPIYLLSFVFNAVWYGELAELTYKKLGGKGETVLSYQSILQGASDELYRNLMFLTTLIFSFLLYTVPLVGPILQFVMITYLYAFFCFDYKWLLQGGISLERRLRHFESHWTYMLGFGLPFTAASYFFPYLISYGVYAIIYPLFIIVAVIARPIKNMDTPHLRKSLPIFDASRRMNNAVVQGITWLRNRNKLPETPNNILNENNSDNNDNGNNEESDNNDNDSDNLKQQ